MTDSNELVKGWSKCHGQSKYTPQAISPESRDYLKSASCEIPPPDDFPLLKTINYEVEMMLGSPIKQAWCSELFNYLINSLQIDELDAQYALVQLGCEGVYSYNVQSIIVNNIQKKKVFVGTKRYSVCCDRCKGIPKRSIIRAIIMESKRFK
jgi:hypothetical protein